MNVWGCARQRLAQIIAEQDLPREGILWCCDAQLNKTDRTDADATT